MDKAIFHHLHKDAIVIKYSATSIQYIFHFPQI